MKQLLMLEASEKVTAVVAPWWGVPVVAGAFLVIGAVLGFVFNWLLESRKAKRENRQRWDTNLLSHTSAVVTLTKAMALAARDYHLFEKNDIDEVASPAARAMHRHYGELQRECDLLDLIATPGMRESSHSIMERALPIVRLEDEDDLIPAFNSLQSAADDLVGKVRKHFGIK